MHSKQPVIVEWFWGFLVFFFFFGLTPNSSSFLFQCIFFSFKCNLRLHHNVNNTNNASYNQLTLNGEKQ